MSKPVFKPGDILTAEAINNYLVNNDAKKKAALETQLAPIYEQIETKMADLNHAINATEIFTKGGRPVYDYEAI
ncbi:hypothetical protein [uncultured Mobiluncus sp.]|uniref:hypothetical protein n=1 Tax=uncultured Mobiluncus sp. TaxID=293425 RepID=UPI002638CF5B|nr:hypothetical protein [uncultured Mobiluncus sp.]